MSYKEEIEKMATSIIDNKDYTSLKCLLKIYDELIRKNTSMEKEKLPFWCYCCCRSQKEGEKK